MIRCVCEESDFGIIRGWLDWKIGAGNEAIASTAKIALACHICNPGGKAFPAPKDWLTTGKSTQPR